MQLYTVNFIPLLSSLYMFRGDTHAHHQEYKVQLYLDPLVQSKVGVGCHGYLFPVMPGTEWSVPDLTGRK